MNRFDLSGKVAVITGGAGLLGRMHAEAIAEVGGTPVLWDINEGDAQNVSKDISKEYQVDCFGMKVDVTNPEDIDNATKELMDKHSHVDILINNAASDPKMDGTQENTTRVENFPLEQWHKDFNVAVTGAFLCSRVLGKIMADQKKGVIINISSDLGLVAPDQRIYAVEGKGREEQFVKPVSYSVVKHAIIGLSKYLSTYWADQNVRVNTLCPGGVFSHLTTDDDFVQRLTSLIPMGRMAEVDEYKGAIQFLSSDASSYMTGSSLVMEGGRTVW